MKKKAINIIKKDTKGKNFTVADFPVDKSDFEDSLSRVKPAYNYKMQEYEKWMKEFGSS